MNYGLDTGMYPRLVHDEVQPEGRRNGRRPPGFPAPPPPPAGQHHPGCAGAPCGAWSGLGEITGMDEATLQPPAGACGEMTGLLLMRAFHEDHGDARRRVIIPDLPTGRTPPACGWRGSRRTGALRRPCLVDARAGEAVDDSVAGLMLTNPNTLGLFEEEIEEIAATHPRRRRALLRRGESERDPRTVSSRRHGFRHRPHQHPQDVRDTARGGGPGADQWG